MSKRVIEQGAEIHFTTERDVFPADHVTIHESGWVEAINGHSYQVEFHPPHKVEGVYTHTSDEQEREILGAEADE